MRGKFILDLVFFWFFVFVLAGAAVTVAVTVFSFFFFFDFELARPAGRAQRGSPAASITRRG